MKKQGIILFQDAQDVLFACCKQQCLNKRLIPSTLSLKIFRNLSLF
ncbi:hypothetical protein Nmel_002067, partial [Mimus melanotis]